MTTEEMLKAAEEMLKAIIEAQVNGGFTEYRSLLNGWKLSLRPKSKNLYAERIDEGYARKVDEDDYIDDYISFPILEILLDTDGIKAAYFYDDEEHDCYCDFRETIGTISGYKKHIAPFQIIDAWNSGEGNNTEEAIKTAYNLLP